MKSWCSLNEKNTNFPSFDSLWLKAAVGCFLFSSYLTIKANCSSMEIPTLVVSQFHFHCEHTNNVVIVATKYFHAKRLESSNEIISE